MYLCDFVLYVCESVFRCINNVKMYSVGRGEK